MRFKAWMDGIEHRVAAGPDGALSIGSERCHAVVTKTGPLRRAVTVGDHTYEVRLIETESDPAAGRYLFEVAGEAIPVEVSEVVVGGAEATLLPTAGRRRKKPERPQLDSASGGIVAPMPGKVAGILVQPGDRVSAGDVVVVLEAMKMENELCAINNAVVKKVLTAVGASVQSGQVLVTLE